MTTSTTSRWIRGAGWAAQPVVIAIVLWLALNGWARSFSVPVSVQHTATHSMAQAKTTIDHGWWWTNPSLGAPSTYQPVLLLETTTAEQLVVRAVGLAVTDVATAVNISWFLLLMVAGASAAWCLRRLGVSSLGAWSAGILFALSPFAFHHNIGELGLMPAFVPFAATAALVLATDAAGDWRRRDQVILLVGCVWLALCTLEYAFFAAFLTGLGAVAGAVRVRRAGRALAGSIVPVAIVLTAFLAVMPTLLAWQREGQPAGARHRVVESELGGLKIRQLVTPLAGHWLPFLEAWNAREAEAKFPYESENQGSRLGLVGSAGFLALLVVLLVPAIAGGGREGETIRAASGLTLAAILLATVGGIGSVLSAVISSQLYAFSRISPFLAFFALAAAALWLDRATLTRRRLQAVVWSAVLVLGLLDQTLAARPLRRRLDVNRADFRELRGFVDGLERQLPRGAMVFQLPLLPFPEDPGQLRMRPYDHFRPYLVSRHLRWSYPALTDAQRRDEAARAGVPLVELPARLARDGFAAIVIDRYGFPDDGEATVAALQAAPSRPDVLAQTQRYVALDLQKRAP